MVTALGDADLATYFGDVSREEVLEVLCP
jgi:hypothetical protein